jgi:hypothetical protein
MALDLGLLVGAEAMALDLGLLVRAEAMAVDLCLILALLVRHCSSFRSPCASLSALSDL